MKKLIFISFLVLNSFALAEIFKIDTSASKIEWLASKKIGKTHNGEIKIKSGDVQSDSKGTINSINVVVDMKSISNIDLKDSPDYQTKLVKHLSNEDFFNVEKFPESNFKLTNITLKPGSKEEYILKGDLTIIGKTLPIEFPAKISSDKNTLTGSAKITIERLKWGLQYGSGNIFKSLTADKVINDTFDLTLNLVAKK